MKKGIGIIAAALITLALCGCGTLSSMTATESGTTMGTAATTYGLSLVIDVPGLGPVNVTGEATASTETTENREERREEKMETATESGLTNGLAQIIAALFSGGVLGFGPLGDLGALISSILAALSNRNAPEGKWWGHPFKKPGTVTITEKEFEAAVEAKAMEGASGTVGFQGKAVS